MGQGASTPRSTPPLPQAGVVTGESQPDLDPTAVEDAVASLLEGMTLGFDGGSEDTERATTEVERWILTVAPPA